MTEKTAAAPALELTGLTKKYAEVTAVDNLNLEVRSGEIYGFLGRNGAGKTTTIRMLLGLIRPDGGTARLFGCPVGTDRSRAVRQVGSLVETATAYPSLTVRENLEIQRRLLGAPPEETERVIALLGLSEYARRRAGRLSLGNRQRLALARALLGRPRLLVLDEPANALDPAGIVEVRELLRRLAREEGTTIFVSSHILGEIALLADRIGIIHRGRLIEEFAAGREAAGSGSARYRLEVSEETRAAVLLKALAGVEEVSPDGGPGRLTVSGRRADPAAMARAVVEAGLELRALIPLEDDLETRFLKLTGGEA